VDGEFIGGCDIVISMHQSGELATLLKEKGVLLEQPKEQQEAAAVEGEKKE
jgi:Glutaredoxin-related protein